MISGNLVSIPVPIISAFVMIRGFSSGPGAASDFTSTPTLRFPTTVGLKRTGILISWAIMMDIFLGN